MNIAPLFRYLSGITLLLGFFPVHAGNTLNPPNKDFSAYKQQSKAESSEFEQFKSAHETDQKEYTQKWVAELKAYNRIASEEITKYHNFVKKYWDKPELSTKKVWVEYSEDLTQQRRVDFENKKIQISTIGDAPHGTGQKALAESLTRMLTKNRTEAFADDVVSQAIEKRSKGEIKNLKTATVKPDPILVPYLTGKQSAEKEEINKIVKHMLANKKESRTVNRQGQPVVTLEVPLEAPAAVENQTDTPREPEPVKQLAKLKPAAQAIEPHVSLYSKKASVDNALVFAVIETESAFNPMARSPVPAYGLMQIVPRSAGQDATKALFGKPRILSPSYLYNSEQNIEIGTTYLNILNYRYLKGIKNEESRLYCVIAAYNTGAGNVAKAFTGKRRISTALKKINKLTPEQVYNHLIHHLPYDETRKYLAKVNNRMTKYEI